ncbi:MAG: DUF3450 family protein [Nitrospiraceae bacterium]|nr:DUF3450 family protein [Nitrospiraceae bacterium]
MKIFVSIILCVVCLFWSFGISIAIDRDFPTQIKRPIDKSISIRQQTQKQEDRWVKEREKLKAEYEDLDKKNKELAAQNKELKKDIAACQSSIESTKKQITEIGRTTKELDPFLEHTYARLTSLIKDDVPFLKGERTQRIVGIRQILDDPNVSISEKYRKTMEALFIEARYGNTIEVYQKKISIDNRPVVVNVFRLGRISLFFQTPDRKTSGYFDIATSAWKILPSSYNRTITAALEIGLKRRPVELLDLPIGRLAVK